MAPGLCQNTPLNLNIFERYFHISSINFYILSNNLVILFILQQMSYIVFAKDRDVHCSEVFNLIDQILVFI